MTPSKLAQRKIPQAARQLGLFARLLQVLLDSGVPLLEALEVLSRQFDDAVFCQVLSEVTDKISQGFTLSRALSHYPRIFSTVLLGLVQAGESTGRLTESLDRLSVMLDKEYKLYQRVRAAFVYPAFVLAVTVMMTLIVFYTVLPNFLQIFRSMNVPLPLVTRLLMAITEGVRNPGCWLIAIGVGLMGTLSLRSILAEREGRLRLYRVLVRIPVAGPIVRYATLTRYFWVLESVIGCGIDLLVSVRLAAGASGSPELEDDAENLCQSLRIGEELSSQFALRPEIYNRLTAQMALTAEETSDMQSAFGHLASWFSQEMDVRVDLLNALIEPVLMTGVALLVGTIVIAIFLPLYSFLGAMGG